MAKEAERRFLVHGRPPVAGCVQKCILQGYAARGAEAPVVSVRLAGGAGGFLQMAEPTADGAAFELAIPRADALEMLSLFGDAVGRLVREPKLTVRVRLQDGHGFVTIKGPGGGDGARDEFEYEVPYAQAGQMMEVFCGPRRIAKTRYLVPYAGRILEVDIFQGFHEGLVIAEVELPSMATPFTPPAWCGEELTQLPQYSNVVLAQQVADAATADASA